AFPRKDFKIGLSKKGSPNKASQRKTLKRPFQRIDFKKGLSKKESQNKASQRKTLKKGLFQKGF
ncbi:hypothetical protein BpHYR1_041162, partial [Brachionus plicatilis]